jgi:hypothetical protein
MSYPLTGQTTALIAIANSRLSSGMYGQASSVTEFILAADNDRSTATLTNQVTVKIPYTNNDHPDFVDGSPTTRVDSLQLYWLNEATGRWQLVSGSGVDRTNKVVTGLVNHLSIFAAFGGGAASDLSSVRVYPNPYRPNGGNSDQGVPYSPGNPATGIIFDHLPQTVTIKIYTVTGQLVTELQSSDGSGMMHWDARNGSGRDVASGGYLAVFTSPGVSHVVKKMLIIR